MWRLSQAEGEAEGLTLLKAENKTGYFGVSQMPGRSKPYQAQVPRGNKLVHLGCFATAEEAALCIARTPEGQEAARWSRRRKTKKPTTEKKEAPAVAATRERLQARGRIDGFGRPRTRPFNES